MNLFLILNPGSRSGNSRRKFAKIFRMLDDAGIQYQYKITEKLEDAYTFSMEANKSGYDAIIAVGGDGTINKVINGFYNNEGKRISNSVFGVIYTGTSPDFCKSYLIPVSLEAAVRTILLNNTRKIKIGKIQLHARNRTSVSDDKQAETKYFACCANVGLGAALARKANSGFRKYLGDFAGTFSALLSILVRFKPADYNCKIDNKEEIIKKCYNLSIGITPLIASGIKVAVDKSIENKLYLMGACELRLSNIGGVIKKIYSGKAFKNNASLWLRYIDNIQISQNAQNPEVEFDGDPAGTLPCSVSLADDELEVLTA